MESVIRTQNHLHWLRPTTSGEFKVTNEKLSHPQTSALPRSVTPRHVSYIEYLGGADSGTNVDLRIGLR